MLLSLPASSVPVKVLHFYPEFLDTPCIRGEISCCDVAGISHNQNSERGRGPSQPDCKKIESLSAIGSRRSPRPEMLTW